MKRKSNILKNNNSDQKFNIDQILKGHTLDYTDIDFEPIQTDIYKSYKELNRSLKANTLIFNSLKLLIPHFDFNLILKPIYTIVLTSIVIIAFLELRENTEPVQFAEITVDKGEKITLHVTDNLTIYLNSESSIKIPLEIKRNSRIYLEGEAFFEINQNKLVDIISDGVLFQTKKASFNINSQREKNELIATVKEGKIDLCNPELSKSTKLTLNKGEKATYNSLAEFISVEKNKNINYLAWNTGIIKFNNTSLNEVSQFISDYYNIPVLIKNDNLKFKTFSASFRNAEIDEILDKIQIAFNCEISGDGSILIIN